MCESRRARARRTDRDHLVLASGGRGSRARAGFTRLIVAAAYTPAAFARWACAAGVAGVILEGPYWAEEPVRTWRAAGLSVMSGLVNDPAILARVLAFEPEHIATDRTCTEFVPVPPGQSGR